MSMDEIRSNQNNIEDNKSTNQVDALGYMKAQFRVNKDSQTISEEVTFKTCFVPFFFFHT